MAANLFQASALNACDHLSDSQFVLWMQLVTPDEIREGWNRAKLKRLTSAVVSSVDAVVEEDKRREQEAIQKFKSLVWQKVLAGAKNIEDAHLQIMRESGCNGNWEILCYDFGLPFDYFKKQTNQTTGHPAAHSAVRL